MEEKGDEGRKRKDRGKERGKERRTPSPEGRMGVNEGKREGSQRGQVTVCLGNWQAES